MEGKTMNWPNIWHEDYAIFSHQDVNWVLDMEYKETSSAVLNEVFTQLYNSHRVIHLYDPEVSDDQPDEFLRRLDDSPDLIWTKFFIWQTGDEYHTGYQKEQTDGRTLLKFKESYPGVTELPPLYMLIEEE